MTEAIDWRNAIYATLSEADQALARSTLFRNSSNIPMPPGVKSTREADWFLRQGLEALRGARNSENASKQNVAGNDRLMALQFFGKARELYRDLGARKGEAIANFCRAYVNLLDGHINQAEFDCQNAVDELLGFDTPPYSEPK
jgi:hypothetical protein